MSNKPENGFEDLNTFLYKKIKEKIKNNELKPGEKIRQIELAEKLGVSRTPLLKVLHRLASENTVKYIPNHGFRVKKLSADELIEIFEVRAIIQGVSAKNVVERAADEEIDRLKSYFLPFKKEDDIDEREYYEADEKFHSSLIQLSGNSLIIKINNMFNIHNFSYQEGLIRPPQETITEHFDLINAIRKRDKFKAQQLAIEHIERSCENIKTKLLDKEEAIFADK
ncbi:MAG: GntR family transcriptional regulator [Halanaerobiaceae bacterium]